MSAVLVVHGGAWAIPDELAKASVDGVKAAARKGFVVLRDDGRALEAVEAAVKALEDNMVFNAGKGKQCPKVFCPVSFTNMVMKCLHRKYSQFKPSLLPFPSSGTITLNLFCFGVWS